MDKIKGKMNKVHAKYYKTSKGDIKWSKEKLFRLILEINTEKILIYCIAFYYIVKSLINFETLNHFPSHDLPE